MNEKMANQTIEDHKYLLELVENKAAIAYFSAANRNQSLYSALRGYFGIYDNTDENKDKNMSELVGNKADVEDIDPLN